ncbi:FAD-binding domain-containing protein [Melanomma pulvis-pyrius CBS 109.77]|uniref:FAD-binding domain-containing protein n=1 Tax=Melanomma pulvis-pyrius CBS 109.77 TaxID=1314802 RepID=A0A6A6WSQ0_9PLEO|nr:FAD-binding domain-containing protein [Melanomma pulvis-pyrius CBS 109.77]
MLQDTLSQVLKEEVLQPGSEDYDKSNGSYFTLFESSVKPAFIVQPTSTQEVSNLIKKLNPLLLLQETHIAIRGTGHTPFAGSANIENGVTVDLRGLKGVSLNADKSVVEISVGETWGSVYEELEKHGLTTAGGRVGRVGVGGLVVLASGSIVHANAQENPDLWVSLRATVAFVKNETDEDTHIMSSAGYAFGHHVVTCCMYHTQGVREPPSLQPFTSIPDQLESYSTMRTGTHIDFCKEMSGFTKDGVRSFYATCTIMPDAALISEHYKAWKEAVEELKSADGFMFSLGYFPLTKALLRNSQAAGGNAMDIDPADGPLFIILLNPTWNSSDDDDRVHRVTEGLLATFRRLASAKNLLHRYIFTNYAYQKEDLFEGYGEESLMRLKEVSKKFDPDGIFQKAVPGGFKLSRAD